MINKLIIIFWKRDNVQAQTHLQYLLIYVETYDNKDRIKGNRVLGGDREEDFDFDSESEQELSNELQELDFNCINYQEEDNFTI